MSNFPGAIDDGTSLPNPSGNSLVAVVDHAGLHDSENAAIIALEQKLGIGATTPSSTTPFLLGTGTDQTAWSSISTASSLLGLGSVAMLNTISLTANVTGTLPVANGGTGVTSMATLAEAVGNLLMPVGYIHIETTGVNPGTSLGFGTWVAYGAGQVLVGNGTSDQAFTAGSTGGESNHTLMVSEIPSHTHEQYVTANPNTGGTGIRDDYNADVTAASKYDQGITTGSTGGGSAHNNLQPYIVVYFWKRTA